ncbi:hypothetical protein ACFLXH_04240 [Chloroflexota bacterium]
MKRQSIIISVSILSICIIGLFSFVPAPVNAAGSIKILWEGYANDINERSQVVGQDFTSGAAVMWDEGKMITLWENGEAKAINNRGQVVGQDFTSCTAVMWYKGKTITLWEDGAAKAINDPGQVAGTVVTKWGDFPRIWDKGITTTLGFVKVGEESLIAINNRGQVVGNLNSGIGWLWFESMLSTLPLRTSGINDPGQIVGQDSGAAVMWDNGEMVTLWENGEANAINNRGQVVGQDSGAAVMWDKGKMITLWENGEAKAINNRGQVVGQDAGAAVMWEK